MSQMQEQLAQHSVNFHILQPKPLINHFFTFTSEAALVWPMYLYHNRCWQKCVSQN